MGGFFFVRLRRIIEPEPSDGYHLEYEEHSPVSGLRLKRLLGVILSLEPSGYYVIDNGMARAYNTRNLHFLIGQIPIDNAGR